MDPLLFVLQMDLVDCGYDRLGPRLGEALTNGALVRAAADRYARKKAGVEFRNVSNA